MVFVRRFVVSFFSNILTFMSNMFNSQELLREKYFRHIKIGFERIIKTGWKSLLDNNTLLKATGGLL